MAVDVERSAAEVTADLDGGDVFQIDRRAVHGFDCDQLQVLRASDEADAAQDELGSIFLHGLAADVEIRVLDRREHLHHGHIRRTHLVRGEFDLILLHESPDAGDFRDALDAGKLIADIPILHGAELGEIVTAVFSLRGIDM